MGDRDVDEAAARRKEKERQRKQRQRQRKKEAAAEAASGNGVAGNANGGQAPQAKRQQQQQQQQQPKRQRQDQQQQPQQQQPPPPQQQQQQQRPPRQQQQQQQRIGGGEQAQGDKAARKRRRGGRSQNRQEDHAAPPQQQQQPQQQQRAAQPAAVMAATPDAGMSSRPEFLSDRTWDEASIRPETRRALAEVFRYSHMSKTQEASLVPASEGQDLFVKAKTGSGKTLGFLIPVVEWMTSHPRPAGDTSIRYLIISPTRELALQIAQEAQQLLTFHGKLSVLTVIGGTNKKSEASKLERNKQLDILVGTPGRLVDHITTTPGFQQRLNVNVVTLDEADRLLDMGFRRELNQILQVLPPKDKRQALLFSATCPPEVNEIAKVVLKNHYRFIDCVGEDDDPTNSGVAQEVLVVSALNVFNALARVLQYHARKPNCKMIVFFYAARVTSFAAQLLAPLFPNCPVVEMHSRMSQGLRVSTSERFRKAKNMIMFSSDVSARGMDYDDIAACIQVGLTDREQYIHRLGRTARAGKSGCGLLLLSEAEAPCMLHALHDLPLAPAAADSVITGGATVGIPAMNPQRLNQPVNLAPLPELQEALRRVESSSALKKTANQAYSAWLGFFNSNLKRLRWSQERLVDECNRQFLSLGLSEIPMLQRKTVGKMGLREVAGLRIAPKGWKPN